MSKKTKLKLSDDWHQEEPLAFLVKCFDTTVHEYKVFANKYEADRFANCERDSARDAGEVDDYDDRIFPLYCLEGSVPSD